MLEIEVKARIPDEDALQRLEEYIAGWESLPERHQWDTYFSHPCRDFAESDEALRIRRQDEECYLTYKGPKKDDFSKTRKEIEVPTSEGIGALLESLGFSEVHTVSKTRRPFRKGSIMLFLDEVEGLGSFLEIESLSGEDVSAEDLLGILHDMGLESETRSYLELLMEEA